MRPHQIFTFLRSTVLSLTVVMTLTSPLLAQPKTASLLSNGDFQADTNADNWPDDWGRPEVGGSYEQEEGNRFLRLTSPSAGKMVLEYREVRLPAEVRAVELSWKQRVSNFKRGKESWFDARIMMDWLDDARKKKNNPGPPAPNIQQNTSGWETRSVKFLKPEGATMLALMPTLFQVQSGTFDLDDVVLQPIDAAPLEAAAKERAAAQAQKLVQEAERRQANAAKNSGPDGELLDNGDLQSDADTNGIPDGWNGVDNPVYWVTQDDNTFLRLVSPEAGKLVLFYRLIDIPTNTQALELKWKQRVSDLKLGKQSWFDARIMLKWKDAVGQQLATTPDAPNTRENTNGWVERKAKFLVPKGAVSLEFMPSLLNVEKGIYDLDDFSLKPTDPAPLLAAVAKAEAEARFINVQPEAAVKEKWPSELHIVRNKVLDKNNKEVRLRGMNIVSLEWNPQGERVLRNTLTAIEAWKSNVIRLPVEDKYWFDEKGGNAYRTLVDNVIMLAANRGAYVLLDLHLYRAPRTTHAEFWKDAAARYKNHPAVLFDLFNEPHSISWEVWQKGGFIEDKSAPASEEAFLTPEDKARNVKGFRSVGMQGLINAARGTGAKNIVIVGGLDWAYDASGLVNGYALDDKGGNGIMVATHIYPWKRDWANKVLPVVDKYPLIVSEFGANTQKISFLPAEDQEDAQIWVPRILGFIEKYKFHYTAFSFHPSAAPHIITGWDYTPTPEWGAFLKRALAGETFGDKGMR